MVELGKRDFIDQGRLAMEMFEDNRAFFGVDIGAVAYKQPQRFRELLNRCVDLCQTKKIQPIHPIQLIDASDMQRAIRTLQKGHHIGKLVVRMPQNDAEINSIPIRDTFSLRSDVSYLLAGGLGGLGRSVATWMAEHGAKNIIFITQSNGKRPKDLDLIQELESLGCTAQVISGSTSKIEDVRRAVDNARFPIAGVMQLSMVLKVDIFRNYCLEDTCQKGLTVSLGSPVYRHAVRRLDHRDCTQGSGHLESARSPRRVATGLFPSFQFSWWHNWPARTVQLLSS